MISEHTSYACMTGRARGNVVGVPHASMYHVPRFAVRFVHMGPDLIGCSLYRLACLWIVLWCLASCGATCLFATLSLYHTYHIA